MNRAERRKLMKKIPHSKKMIKTITKESVENLEAIFREKWERNGNTEKETEK